MTIMDQLLKLFSEQYDEYVLQVIWFKSPDRALAFLKSMSFCHGEGEDLSFPSNVLLTLVRDPQSPKSGPASAVVGGMLTVEQCYEVQKAARSQKLKTVATAVGDKAAQNLVAASGRLRTDCPQYYRKWWQFWK